MNIVRYVGFLVCFLVLLQSHVFGQELGPNTSPEDISADQTDQSFADDSGTDVIEKKGHYFHPFLSLNTYYTDNVFNDPDNERDDVVFNIIPGIWLAYPGSKQPLLRMNTSTTVPGGLMVSRFVTPAQRKFQGYALYRANIRRYDQYTDEDTTNHHAEGLLRYNFRNEASIEAVNIYERNQDPYATGDNTRELDKFKSNYFNVMGTLPVSTKLGFRADYTNYYLNYKKDRRSWRNRKDNAVAGYVYYKISPKTAPFLEYEYVDINYDEDTLKDSYENRFYVGTRWRYSDKTSARVKIGYGEKNFDGSGVKSQDDILGEARVDYQYSEKTSFNLVATRQFNESDIEEYQYMLSHRLRLGYNQRLMPRLEGKINLSYAHDSYKDTIAVDDNGKRKDNYYRAEVALGYTFREWLLLGGGYRFTTRDSNDSDFDYDTNLFFLSITFAI